jgi:hypothetical protein
LAELESQSEAPDIPLKGGGSGGTSGGMDDGRITAIEKRLDRFEAKFDMLIDRVSEMKGQLGAMPSAATFGEIKGALGKLEGRIDSLPSTAKMSGIVAIVTGIAVFLLKAPELVALFHK